MNWNDQELGETWHWERAGDEHRNPVVWVVVPAVIVLAAVGAVLAWALSGGVG